MQSQVACAYGVQDLKKRKSPQKRGAKAWRNMLVRGKMHSGEEQALKNRKSRLQSGLGSQWDEKSELFAQTWLVPLPRSFFLHHAQLHLAPVLAQRYERTWKPWPSVLCVSLSMSPLS